MTFLILGIIALILLPIVGYRLEKKAFNNGICPDCGKKLTYFDTDSQGGRGYKCKSKKCDYYTWVSFSRIDKEYK